MKTVLNTKGICLIHNHNYKENPEKYTVYVQRKKYKDKIHEYTRKLCLECKINRRKEHYIKNKEYELKRNKNWRDKNPEKLTLIARINSLKHYKKIQNLKITDAEAYDIIRKKRNILSSNWKKNNPEKKNKLQRLYRKRRKARDPSFKLLANCRTHIYKVLKGNIKSKKTKELLGCTVEELKRYLSNKFVDNMSFENYGKWHIDHIIPCASFDFTKPEEQAKCFHYTNLQPLWAIDNIKKGAKYDRSNEMGHRPSTSKK